MAEYDEPREPAIVREREVIREEPRETRPVVRRKHHATPYILLTLLALVILGYFLYRAHPFSSGRSTSVNVNVPTPTLNHAQ